MHQPLKKAARKHLSFDIYHDDILEEYLILEDQEIYTDTRGWHAFEGSYDSSNADEWYLNKNKDIVFDYIFNNSMYTGTTLAQYVIADTCYFIVPLKNINLNCEDFKYFSTIDIESLSSVFHVIISFTSKYWYERNIDKVTVSLVVKDRYNEYAYRPNFMLHEIKEDNDYPDFINTLTQKLIWRYVNSHQFKIKQLEIDPEEFVSNYQFYLEVGEMIDY